VIEKNPTYRSRGKTNFYNSRKNISVAIMANIFLSYIKSDIWNHLRKKVMIFKLKQEGVYFYFSLLFFLVEISKGWGITAGRVENHNGPTFIVVFSIDNLCLFETCWNTIQ